MNEPTEASSSIDPVTLEVIDNRIDEVVREMQHVMYRTGYSTIIRDMKDGSAGITLPDGRVIGQDFRLPLHAGVFPPTVEAIREAFDDEEIGPRDAFLVNDPYRSGANHPPDFMIATPVYHDGAVQAFCLTIAHKPDIGADRPESLSSEGRDIFQEGLLLPPVKYHEAGEVNDDLERIIEANSRTPRVTLGDVRGQHGSTRLGVEKLGELLEEYGAGTVREAAERILESTRASVVETIRPWDGERTVRGELDSTIVDGEPIAFQLTVSTQAGDDTIRFDFEGTDPQTDGHSNMQPHVAKSACMVGIVGIVDPELPLNAGIDAVAEYHFPEGSLVNPIHPAPCANYAKGLGVLTHMSLRALSHFSPGTGVAETGNRGTVNLSYPPEAPDGEPLAQMEILGSGYGGNAHGDGASCMATSYESNVRFTPIEIIETEFPVRLRRFAPSEDSAGAGEHRGGVGFVREYELLREAEFNYAGTNHLVSAQGFQGGLDAPNSRCVINPGRDDETPLETTQAITLSAGDVIRVERSGGAGYGDPFERDPEAVLADVRDGVVSHQAARNDYGVASIEDDTEPVLDRDRTVERREPDQSG